MNFGRILLANVLLLLISTSVYAETLTVYAFIGRGSLSKDLGLNNRLHEVLLKTGHVGMSFDHGQTIYGFGPQKPPNYDLDQLLGALLKREKFPGHISNDTEIFKIVSNKEIPNVSWDKLRLTHKLSGLQVYAVDLEVSDEVIKKFQIDINTSKKQGLNKLYSFPDLGSALPHTLDNTFNCATYPVSLGIDNWPDKSGFVIYFAEKMLKMGSFRKLDGFPEATLTKPPVGSFPVKSNHTKRKDMRCADLLMTAIAY